MKSLSERFWTKVDICGPDECCWEWQGAKDKDGYGRFDLQLKPVRRRRNASRIALVLTLGESDKLPLHSCDNPPCCNPAHLSWGTQFDNMQQMVARGRYRGGYGSTPIPVVRAIRRAYDEESEACGGIPGKDCIALVAEVFGVSTATADRIGRRESYVAVKL